MKKIRFASIGTSQIASIFCESLKCVDEGLYKGCYSRDLQRAHSFGEKYGATLFFDDLDSLSQSDEIDAVYIASPNALHKEQALKMIRAKKHVLIEKPMALTYEDAKIIFDEAEKYGVVALEAMRTVHDPNFVKVAQIVDEMEDIHEASFVFSKISSKWDKLKQGIVTSAFSPLLGGGALRDMGIYTVEPCVFMFGYPKACFASANMFEVEAEGILDLSGKAVLDYGDMTCCLSWGKDHDSHLYSQISSENSTVIVDHIQEPSSVKYIVPNPPSTGYSTGEGIESDVELVEGQMSLEAEIRDFSYYILNDPHTQITLEKAQTTTLDSTKLVEYLCEFLQLKTY